MRLWWAAAVAAACGSCAHGLPLQNVYSNAFEAMDHVQDLPGDVSVLQTAHSEPPAAETGTGSAADKGTLTQTEQNINSEISGLPQKQPEEAHLTEPDAPESSLQFDLVRPKISLEAVPACHMNPCGSDVDVCDSPCSAEMQEPPPCGCEADPCENPCAPAPEPVPCGCETEPCGNPCDQHAYSQTAERQQFDPVPGAPLDEPSADDQIRAYPRAEIGASYLASPHVAAPGASLEPPMLQGDRALNRGDTVEGEIQGQDSADADDQLAKIAALMNIGTTEDGFAGEDDSDDLEETGSDMGNDSTALISLVLKTQQTLMKLSMASKRMKTRTVDIDRLRGQLREQLAALKEKTPLLFGEDESDAEHETTKSNGSQNTEYQHSHGTTHNSEIPENSLIAKANAEVGSPETPSNASPNPVDDASGKGTETMLRDPYSPGRAGVAQGDGSTALVSSVPPPLPAQEQAVHHEMALVLKAVTELLRKFRNSHGGHGHSDSEVIHDQDRSKHVKLDFDASEADGDDANHDQVPGSVRFLPSDALPGSALSLAPGQKFFYPHGHLFQSQGFVAGGVSPVLSIAPNQFIATGTSAVATPPQTEATQVSGSVSPSMLTSDGLVKPGELPANSQSMFPVNVVALLQKLNTLAAKAGIDVVAPASAHPRSPTVASAVLAPPRPPAPAAPAAPAALDTQMLSTHESSRRAQAGVDMQVEASSSSKVNDQFGLEIEKQGVALETEEVDPAALVQEDIRSLPPVLPKAPSDVQPPAEDADPDVVAVAKAAGVLGLDAPALLETSAHVHKHHHTSNGLKQPTKVTVKRRLKRKIHQAS